MTGEESGEVVEPRAADSPTAAGILLQFAAQAFCRVRDASFIHVNLDSVAHNIQVLKSLSGPNTGIMGVVKGGAYGSGMMKVVEVLVEEGVKELSVAKVGEAVYLRKRGINHPITVLGNLSTFELPDVMQYNLIPSLSWTTPLTSVPRDTLVYPDGSPLRVAINIDTGMSRYGVQPCDLRAMVHTLDDLGVSINSMYTHLQGSITEKKKNQKQIDIFLEATEPYKERPLTRHLAATTGCVQDLGTHLDFIRPGGAITGLSSGADRESAQQFANCGFRPAFSVVVRPTYFKLLPAGRFIGYDATYETRGDEWIANFTTGWSDGLSRRLSNGVGAVKRVKTGELCPIVGRVSMDSITVRLPEAPGEDDVFQVITDDFDDVTSAVGMARNLGAAVYEMPGNWSTRLARVYSRNGKIVHVCNALEYEC
ncbi:alanine racemase-like [Homarus americanus]|uniref:Alanine racemase-like n=1 Tax=Homarus americanus TaxID=6706 RepID=A0A8J5K6L5_HOMAM|nr:alanine racemase-like [Homarus americanus]XP_042222632.1 alanine racemase-like [Homarus americanus]KAG7168663.1 Alanine racemase-like [Homarus americanus]